MPENDAVHLKNGQQWAKALTKRWSLTGSKCPTF